MSLLILESCKLFLEYLPHEPTYLAAVPVKGSDKKRVTVLIEWTVLSRVIQRSKL